MQLDSIWLLNQKPRQRRGICSAVIIGTRFNSFLNERSLRLHSRRGAQFLSVVADRRAVFGFLLSGPSARPPRRPAALISKVRAPPRSHLPLNDISFVPTKPLMQQKKVKKGREPFFFSHSERDIAAQLLHLCR